jgi:adsorption protein B
MMDVPWIEILDALAATLLLPLLISYIIFGLDDAWIDWQAWSKGLKPSPLLPKDLEQLKTFPRKPLAILIAAWKESEVIGSMLMANLRRIDYPEAHFFIGVYPNDPDTLREVENFRALYAQAHVVINTRLGPTSKGQMINQLVQGVFAFETQSQTEFAGLVLHDCEDILHPLEMRIINRQLHTHDFVQLPVFSFDLPALQWVGGTYLDEFAEILTKDQLVRNDWGIPFPASGVNTAVSRRLALTLCRLQNGHLVNEQSLTEDYELGIHAGRLGFAQIFVCKTLASPGGKPDFVATREYFPRSFWRAVKQKTRWVVGIVFQGSRNMKWTGGWLEKYFLYRDRKGLICNWVNLASYLVSAYLFVRVSTKDFSTAQDILSKIPLIGGTPWMMAACLLSSLLMLNRIFQRAVCTYRVHGLSALGFLWLRMPLGVLINAVASVKATQQYLTHAWFGKGLTWTKTEHYLPLEFQKPREVT